MLTVEEARKRWHAANALRADHGEEESPEYKTLAETADYWLQALLMTRLRESNVTR